VSVRIDSTSAARSTPENIQIGRTLGTFFHLHARSQTKSLSNFHEKMKTIAK
jgi:hypothetical protein